MKNNWLQHNVSALLAILFTLFSLSIYLLVLVHAISATENLSFLIINSVTNIMMIIIGYYYGSSAGSKQKQMSLDKISDNTTTISSSVKTDNIPVDGQ